MFRNVKARSIALHCLAVLAHHAEAASPWYTSSWEAHWWRSSLLARLSLSYAFLIHLYLMLGWRGQPSSGCVGQSWLRMCTQALNASCQLPCKCLHYQASLHACTMCVFYFGCLLFASTPVIAAYLWSCILLLYFSHRGRCVCVQQSEQDELPADAPPLVPAFCPHVE